MSYAILWSFTLWSVLVWSISVPPDADDDVQHTCTILPSWLTAGCPVCQTLQGDSSIYHFLDINLIYTGYDFTFLQPTWKWRTVLGISAKQGLPDCASSWTLLSQRNYQMNSNDICLQKRFLWGLVQLVLGKWSAILPACSLSHL